MESVFEEKPETNPVIGGWNMPNEDNDLLATLLSKPSLLEKNQYDSYVYERIRLDQQQKVYAYITNEVFYIVKSKKEKELVKWIDLRFRRVEQISYKNQIGVAIYGDNTRIDIFFTSDKSFKIWYEFFAQYCIQLNIEQFYIQETQIGEGNYAKVYIGKEISTNKVIAIKQISKTLLRESSRNVCAMINEIESMRNIRHQNICGLLGIFESQTHVDLILEYCPGGELFNRIVKRRKFTEYNAARVAQNMLNALVYLHEEANVVHRDIKPENIMLLSNDNDYDCKLADFGLATKFDPVTKEISLRCGSPGYVAPEILRTNSYGPKCDVFSLGIVIYILLVGRQPFYGKNPQEVLLQNKDCNINFQAKHWQEISKEALHFVITCVDPDPSSRPSAREVLKHNWFKTVFPNMNNLVPANEVSTPKNRRIEPLSASFDASTKNISRDKISEALKKEVENRGIWQEAVNSPVPSKIETFSKKLPKLANSNPTTPQKQIKDITFSSFAAQATSLSTTPQKTSQTMGFRKQSTLPSSNSSTPNRSSKFLISDEGSEEEKTDDKRRKSYEMKSSLTKNGELRISQLSTAGKLVIASSPQKKSSLSKQVRSTNKKSKLRNSSKAPKRISQENLRIQLDAVKSPDQSPKMDIANGRQKKAIITPIFIK